MISKITKTTYKYDSEGKIIEKTEEVTEYIKDTNTTTYPYSPFYPTQPNIYYLQDHKPSEYDWKITCTL